jgi:hypothetical protein
MENRSLFTAQNRNERHERLNKALPKYNAVMDWEIFREDTEAIYRNNLGKGGRPSYDPILKFKILFLQRLYDLSDNQMEFQILGRLIFQKFLGLGENDNIPDAKTIWAFKERIQIQY